MKVREVMSTNVACCTGQDSMETAADKMESLNVGAIPVVNKGQVIGMVTDRDLAIRGVAHNGAENISQVMSQNVVTISPDASVEEAAALMAQHQIRRLPVVEDGQLVGMLSIGDLSVNELSNETAGVALTDISKNF
ncbi:CBS domain-containing protein [Bacillus ectoiniformans]|uniref:CBS domain-containing protein n=1 Tax=Bacillus ectoiniformans TaxID=1494429 RepID=UPI001956363B|nr:CBS domain-containing protein [Bacillus ectoiniformans]MBM7649432.1 CBS domain-containing protein [Bacillus ectoiniformans]